MPDFTKPPRSKRVRQPMSIDKKPDTRQFWVYVIQSLEVRYGKRGQQLPGFHYVGCTTDPPRRIRQHNGEIVGGSRYTSQHRPWEPRALYGPYTGQTEALKAERALKHGKVGTARTRWSTDDSPWCRGSGPEHPWVSDPTQTPTP